MDTFFSISEVVGSIVFIWAIVACFRNGRKGMAWFGAAMFVTGAALSFGGYRYVREGVVDEWWWWVFRAQGLTILVMLTSVAIRSASNR